MLLSPPSAPRPSPWVLRWSHLVPAGARVLDLACGSGRHARWWAGHGASVLAMDRDEAALAGLADVPDVQVRQADLEGAAWPFGPEERFAGIVVTNYLHRPLLPRLPDLLAPGGVLIYETFAAGQASIGRPSNPDFLLQPGELLHAWTDLRVVAYEDGFEASPPRFVQRLVAVREVAGAAEPARHRLSPADPGA